MKSKMNQVYKYFLSQLSQFQLINKFITINFINKFICYTKKINFLCQITANFNPYLNFMNNDLSFQSDTDVPKPVPAPDAKVLPGTSSDISQHKNTCKY